jgi:hypothetical protein
MSAWVLLLVTCLIVGMYAVLQLRARWQLRRMPQQALEQMAFADPLHYLRDAGLTGPAADRLASLVTSRDVDTLRREWRAIERQLLAAERDAGHRGRPLIMDYLLDYHRVLRELQRRSA